MSLQVSLLESLPNELIDQIISHLSTLPPSSACLHQPPNINLARSRSRDLKNLSLASSQTLEVVRPRLFSHVCFDLRDISQFLSFVSALDLASHVTSVLVRGRHSPDHQEDPFWWRQVLRCLDPLRITVIAPPSFIGAMLGAQIFDGHSWAFEVPLQILQLEREPEKCNSPERSSQDDSDSSLLGTRTWSSMLFNESSSLRAYNHYEYFLFQVPSLFSTWGSVASIIHDPERPLLSLSFNNLTSFRYTAVFPFYNHVKLVLNAVELMTNLRSLSVQLAPCQNDKATELEQRGSMDPSDPWMELATGYSLIAHAVKDLGEQDRLTRFSACDYSFEALRTELSTILGDILDGGEWVHDSYGTWNRGAHKPLSSNNSSTEALKT